VETFSLTSPLSAFRLGVFVAEIDDRMLSGELDLAVHSMKDIPTKRPEELGIAAILKRDSPTISW